MLKLYEIKICYLFCEFKKYFIFFYAANVLDALFFRRLDKDDDIYSSC